VSGADWTGAVTEEYYRITVDEPADPEFRVAALPHLALQSHLVPRDIVLFREARDR